MNYNDDIDYVNDADNDYVDVDVDELEAKPLESYSQQTKDEMNRVSLVKDKTRIFGSYIYRYQKFPGDIDLVENYTSTSKEEAILFWVKRIKKIVKNVISTPGNYYSEIKCGVDEVFSFSIGIIHNGTYVVDPDLFNNLDISYQSKYITLKDYEDILSVLKAGVLSQDAFDYVFKILRKYYVLRWSANEILKGFKKLPGIKPRIITLEQACTHYALVKIDTVVLIDGVFTEVTNAYRLKYITKTSDERITDFVPNPTANKNQKGYERVEFTSEAEINQLPLEINKMYYSNLWFSPFKMLKRTYSYCRYQIQGKNVMDENGFVNVFTPIPDSERNQYIDIIDKIVPILSGNISLLYQIRSEFDSLMLIMDLYAKTNKLMDQINTQLDNTKNRLAYVMEIPRHKLLEFITLIDKCVRSKDFPNRIKILDHLVDEFKLIINYETLSYLDSVNMNPMPAVLKPKPVVLDETWETDGLYGKKYIPLYNNNRIRLPGDQPMYTYNKIIQSLKDSDISPDFYDKDDENNTAHDTLREMLLRKYYQD